MRSITNFLEKLSHSISGAPNLDLLRNREGPASPELSRHVISKCIDEMQEWMKYTLDKEKAILEEKFKDERQKQVEKNKEFHKACWELTKSVKKNKGPK